MKQDYASLQTQNAANVKKLKQLQQQSVSIKSENEDQHNKLQQQVNNLKQKNNNLNDNIRGYEDTIASLKKHKANDKRDIDAHLLTINNLKNENKSVKEQNQSLHDLEQEIAKLRQENDTIQVLKKENMSKSTEYEEFKQKWSAQKVEMDEIKDKLDQQLKELENERCQKQELYEQNTALQTKCTELTRAQQEFEVKWKEITAENESLNNEKDEIRQQKENVDKQLKILQGDMDELSAQKNKIEGQLNELQASNDTDNVPEDKSAIESVNKLQQQLSSLKSEYQQKLKDIDDLNQQNDKYQETIAYLNDTIKSNEQTHKSTINSFKNENDSLKQQNEEINDLKQLNDGYIEKINHLNDTIEGHEITIKSLQENNGSFNTLSQQLEELKADRNDIQSRLVKTETERNKLHDENKEYQDQIQRLSQQLMGVKVEKNKGQHIHQDEVSNLMTFDEFTESKEQSLELYVDHVEIADPVLDDMHTEEQPGSAEIYEIHRVLELDDLIPDERNDIANQINLEEYQKIFNKHNDIINKWNDNSEILKTMQYQITMNTINYEEKDNEVDDTTENNLYKQYVEITRIMAEQTKRLDRIVSNEHISQAFEIQSKLSVK